MSRKTNNLRKRLRIQQEAEKRRSDNLLRSTAAQIERLKRDLDFPRSVMVHVEQDPHKSRWDLYGVQLTFMPDAYVHAAWIKSRGEASNFTCLAQMIGREIGEKVERAIIERLKADTQFGGRPRW